MILRTLLVFPLLYAATCTAQSFEVCIPDHELSGAAFSNLVENHEDNLTYKTNTKEEFIEPLDQGKTLGEQSEKKNTLVPWSKLSINILKKPLYACILKSSFCTKVMDGDDLIV